MKKKPYIRYVILGILATLMVGCIIRIAMPNREWNYTGSYTFAEGESYTEEPWYLSIFRWGTGGIQLCTELVLQNAHRGMPSRSAMWKGLALCIRRPVVQRRASVQCTGVYSPYDFWLYVSPQKN
ncbi:MAG: hypothetical protein ACLVGL_17425 [Waltera sp.]